MRTPVAAILLAFCALFISGAVHSQDSTRVDSTRDAPIGDKAFTRVEVESTFPGGDHAWLAFLNAHLVYPSKAVRKRME